MYVYVAWGATPTCSHSNGSIFLDNLGHHSREIITVRRQWSRAGKEWNGGRERDEDGAERGTGAVEPGQALEYAAQAASVA